MRCDYSFVSKGVTEVRKGNKRAADVLELLVEIVVIEHRFSFHGPS